MKIKKYTVRDLINEITTTSTEKNSEEYNTPFAFSKKGYNPRVVDILKRWGYSILEDEELLEQYIKDKEVINEELQRDDYIEIKGLIRQEIAILLYDLFKKRNVWIR